MKPQFRVVFPIACPFLALLVVLAVSARGADSKPAKTGGDVSTLPPPSNGAISPQDQADALHFIISADREISFQDYVTRQTAGGALAEASGGGESSRYPLSPCEIIRRSAESIQIKGAEFSFALRSLHPVDPRNGPQTELEQHGLALVSGQPTQVYYGQEMLGGRRYFTAVYPDLIAAKACIDCHDARSASISHRYRVGETMGGIVVRVPLEF